MLILRSQFGMTLVEIMIAIAIMGLLLAMGIPSYQSWVQNAQIRTAAESVQNGLQLARAEAVNRNAQVSFTLNGNNWSVDIVANPTYGVAASAVQSRSGAGGTSNAVIASTQNVVTFNGTGRVTPVPAGNIVFAVTNPKLGACTALGASNGARCMDVLVGTTGTIRMCDPAMALATNPQGCF